jgi:A/G-specific adenine glycosylase
MILVQKADSVFLERRPSTGIWGGLYSLPELGSADDVADWCERVFRSRPKTIRQRAVHSHSFTHFDLDILPLQVEVDAPERVADTADVIWYTPGAPQQVGIAAPVRTLIDNMGLGK